MGNDKLAKHMLNVDGCHNCEYNKSYKNISLKADGSYDSNEVEQCSLNKNMKLEICKLWEIKGPDVVFGSMMPVFSTGSFNE